MHMNLSLTDVFPVALYHLFFYHKYPLKDVAVSSLLELQNYTDPCTGLRVMMYTCHIKPIMR